MNYFGITQLAPKGAFVPQHQIDEMLGFVGTIQLPNNKVVKTITREAFAVWSEGEPKVLLGITTWSEIL